MDQERSAPLEPPQESWRDVGRKLFREGANTVTGGVAGTLFDEIIRPAVVLRRQEFEAELCERVNRLIKLGRTTEESLQRHEQFITTYTEATLAAVRTHQREKRDSLRNAVLNAGLPGAPDETRQQLYLRWIDELTPLHVRVLRACQNENYHPGRLEGLLNRFDEIRDLGLVVLFENDLVSRNLIKPNRPLGVAHLNPGERWISELGADFLSFIRDPLDD